MFAASIYQKRREILKTKLSSGIVLLLGNQLSPRNYPGNPYPFRQDSTFLYYFGLDGADLIGILDIDQDQDLIFGPQLLLDDMIWSGKQASIEELGEQSGIKHILSKEKLKTFINNAKLQNRLIHFLPSYRSEQMMTLAMLLGFNPLATSHTYSLELIHAIVSQRERKSSEEIQELEKAVNLSADMHIQAMKMAKKGMIESEIAAEMQRLSIASGGDLSFPPIVTIQGEILHNPHHRNRLGEGNLVLIDAGAETSTHYCGDITRTFPVNANFTNQQREIYSLVLAAQTKAVKELKPDIAYRDIHFRTAKIMVEGLQDLGCMQGDSEEAVTSGAYALFFPHGLGHMLGLDVHDMENFGEDNVGYTDEMKRSSLFGLRYLRLAKKLKPGFVITVEPGIYFIPDLIDRWKAEKRFPNFIKYDRLDAFRSFGGIRIEDNYLITHDSARLLGKPIPRKIDDVEALRRVS